MPLDYLQQLTSIQRSDRSNRHLARYLAFLAGAANAGGFLAVHQYTSHMTGLVSAMADNLATGKMQLVSVGGLAVFAFFFGAIVTTILIRTAKSRGLNSRYALPLVLEAVVLASFFFSTRYSYRHSYAVTIVVLCFSMGLQNSMITKISGHVIRTTHLTGMVTDIGICCGRLLSAGAGDENVDVNHEVHVLRLLASLVALFFFGAIVGAVGFQHVRFAFMLPISAVLLLLAIVPVAQDLKGGFRLAE